VSCHRCGNIRKRKVMCPAPQCPHIFCGRCAEKLKEEHGPDIFTGGCPFCKEACCCSNKNQNCDRKHHCYRKCPLTKSRSAAACVGASTNCSISSCACPATPEVTSPSSPVDSAPKRQRVDSTSSLSDVSSRSASPSQPITHSPVHLGAPFVPAPIAVNQQRPSSLLPSAKRTFAATVSDISHGSLLPVDQFFGRAANATVPVMSSVIPNNTSLLAPQSKPYASSNHFFNQFMVNKDAPRALVRPSLTTVETNAFVSPQPSPTSITGAMSLNVNSMNCPQLNSANRPYFASSEGATIN
jgi:hypothetical protein